MYVFEQASGKFSEPGQDIFVNGYSGHGAGKNNPGMQNIPAVGPIPAGRYVMRLITDGQGNPVNYEGKMSPVIRLIPNQNNNMFGRSGFLIHGEGPLNLGEASNGCIILPRFVRLAIASQLPENDQLEVISGIVPQDPEISV